MMFQMASWALLMAGVAANAIAAESSADKAVDWFSIRGDEVRWRYDGQGRIRRAAIDKVTAIVVQHAPASNTLTVQMKKGAVVVLRRKGETVQIEAEWLSRATGVPLTVTGDEAPSRVPSEPKVAMARLSPELAVDVGQTLREATPQFSECVERDTQSSVLPEGVVLVDFVLHSEGTVRDVRVSGSTMNRPTIESCIAKHIGSIDFDALDAPGPWLVRYPFSATQNLEHDQNGGFPSTNVVQRVEPRQNGAEAGERSPR
ncbi:MAG: AgmX/PglI C-terminal domain-containing protein [Myxococcota bacterium]